MKSELRDQILSEREAMDPGEVLKRSLAVKRLLFATPEYRSARTILFYISYDNEVNTHPMIQASFSEGKRVVVPKSNVRETTLLLCELRCWDELAPGAYSILEPREDSVREVPVESIDLMIIPGVVFDLEGNRIGHGMGYYDRLLHTVHKATRVGLAFGFQVFEKIPYEKHDIRVQKIITEDRVITCQD
jgi:5-formyltetrahydrofolate cyclo-ligase